MSGFLIGLFIGAMVGVFVVCLCIAARGNEAPQMPLIIKKEQRVEKLSVTNTAPKGTPDRSEEIARRLGTGLLHSGLIKIDRSEGMEWTITTGTVLAVVPEKEAEQ